jgi:hypothetical protein
MSMNFYEWMTTMPGNILHAECCCGFQRKLSPGSAIAGNRCVGYSIAYNADESDLLTEDDAIIKSWGLRTVRDPFIFECRPEDSLEKFMYENFEKKEVVQGPYLCPRCKAVRLTLRFGGNWD